MRLLNERAEIAGVAQKWKDQYFRNGKWGSVMLGDPRVIYENLLALPKDATREDVASVIGTTGWIGSACTECGGVAVILVGEEPDYESHTVYLCLDCARKVTNMIESGSRD